VSLIAEGRHAAICRSIQLGWTSTGKEQLAVEFQIDGPDDPDAGRSITWFGFFTDKTFDKTVEALRALGWTGPDLTELPALAEAGDLAQVVEIVVGHEEYGGELSARVRWVNKPGAGRVKLEKPMSADEARMFAARVRARMAGGRPTGAAPVPRAAARPSWGATGSHAFDPTIPPPDQNDLPF
jgi:hypothetical protein